MRILENNILKKMPHSNWFYSDVIQDIADKLNKLSHKKTYELINDIKSQNWEKIYCNPVIESCNKLKIMCGQKLKIEKDLWVEAQDALMSNKIDKLSDIIDKLTPKNKKQKAYMHYFQAWIALYEGDLLNASQSAALAANGFKKSNFLYEEACAYQLNGTIYRLAAVCDTAEFMLRSALEIFEQIGATAKQAETYGYLGMLMIMQQRDGEADSHFKKALALFEDCNDKVGYWEIINQQALSYLINHHPHKTLGATKKAIEVFAKLKNKQGEAFSYDLAAQAAWEAKFVNKAEEYAKKARELYKKTGNVSAGFEMEYLSAQIALEKNQFQTAESILRQIIKSANHIKSSFHIANAYNLLGIIYMKQGDCKRAEGIFQQSLSAELQNDRQYGIAIDYANIALANYGRGFKNKGDKNLELAIEYANSVGDEALLNILKQLVKS